MKRWVLNIIQAQSRDAVTKPKSDVTKIAESLGYTRVSVRIHNTRDMLDDTLRAQIGGAIAEVEKGDIFLYQFPTLMGFRFEEMFVSCLKQKGAKVIVLMHDSEWLRGFYPEENKFLNSVDAVIGHGDKMNDALRDYGVQTKIINKELFDYLLDEELPLTSNLEKKLVIAGNLNKSIFIEKWDQDMPELYAFGSKNNDTYGENVRYQGSFIANDLAKNMPNNYFGISWDDKLPGGGDYQAYTRFNSPHKVSLYLSLGIPVIVWDQSAIADVIIKNNLGFSVTSPDEIKEKLAKVSELELVELKKNANHFAEILRSGMLTRKAIIQAENIVYDIKNDC